MKNNCGEMQHMHNAKLCKKCRSVYIHEIKSQSFSGWLLKAAGCQQFCCERCGFRWKESLPMQPLLNLIYLFLVAEIIFLMTNDYRVLIHYLYGFF